MNKVIMDRMPATPDVNQERLEQLRALIPDLFANDGALNPDELKRLIDPDLAPESERFEFRWFGKANAKRNAFTPTLASLEYDQERSVNPELASGNAIIEGENLEVLKCLLAAYRNRIKCIYIDPPYNTGNDFVYSDSWDQDRKTYWEHVGITEKSIKVDTNTKADGRFHSNWLNMMYPRLLLARQLLRDDGVIFISIDDNELHHLRKLCDEVFGPEFFVAQFTWNCRQFTDARSLRHLSTDHEYVLCYARSEDFAFRGTPRDESKFSNPDNDARGPWMSRSILGLATRDQRPNLHYSIIDPSTGVVFHPPEATGWRYSKERMQQLINNHAILFPGNTDGRPREKKFRSDLGDVFTSFPTIIKDIYTSHGTAEIRDLFGAQIFDFAKPSQLIRSLCEQASSGEDIILDFFAGSGPTGQSIWELNTSDGGNRKFILVQLPEAIPEQSEAHNAGYRKISDITVDRNRRVAARLNEAAATAEAKAQNDLPGFDEAMPSLYRVGFKVFHLAKSRFPRTEFLPDPEKTDEENLEVLDAYIREKEAAFQITFDQEEILQEVLLKNGFMLDVQTESLTEFTDNAVLRAWDSQKEAVVCLDYDLKEQTIAKLKDLEGIFICLEQALNTTKKWNLRAEFGERLVAF
ncbi:MAG: site-specific DNA-methyltransferase [Gammaproteobacteria bacterium]|nr:site-specific DNA-methyltransferase [Gammaproteobacteria bacterium]MCY4283279.1 site-specific DNA-methyltransferase [Gammaproteobacteria bacterium]MCY4339062.1 site-specific DNA-methyltransferase [Gammaproteobacteria bacterium]